MNGGTGNLVQGVVEVEQALPSPGTRSLVKRLERD